jgi:hypothetical protein
MWTTYLTKKRGMYKALSFINFLAILIAPFINSHLFVVDEGGGTAGEQEKKEAEEKMFNAIEAKMKSLIEDAYKGLSTKKEIDKRFEDFNKEIKEQLNVDEFKKLNESVLTIIKNQEEQKKTQEVQGIALKKIQETGVTQNKGKMGIGDILLVALKENDLLEKNEDLSNISGEEVFKIKGTDKRRGTIASVESKSVIDMTTALAMAPGSTPGTNIGSITAYQMREVLLNASKDMSAFDVFPVTPITDKYFGVIVEYDKYDGTATTDENTPAGQSSFELKTIEHKVFKINTYYHVSEENLEDIPTLVAKINRIGNDRINQKVNTKIFATTGNGITDIKGMLASGNYTAFVASTYAATVEDANLINLIGKMKLQAEETDDNINVVALHPRQVDEIEQNKDAIGNSLMDRSVIFDNLGRLVSIKGCLVFKTKKITAGTCAVFSNEAAEIGLRKGISAIIGLDSDDLTNGMRTIVISIRAAFGVGKPSSIIYCSNITTDLEIINATAQD